MFNFKMPYRDRVPSSDESDREDAESLLEKQGGSSGSKPNSQQSSHLRSPSTILLFTASHLLIFTVALWLGSQFLSTSRPFNMDSIQHWSTVRKDVPTTYHTTTFNGSFLHANIYRQDASPSVDAAWEALGVNYRALAIPEEDAARSGISPAHVRINPKYGGGYPANVEGLHHLHCLNLVRQGLQWNYGYYAKKGKGAFSNEDYIVKLHITHCLDIIRQQLMCTVDTGVLGQVWWGSPEEPEGFVDFNTHHQCKNYEAIRAWAEERQLPDPDTTPPDFLLPPRSAADILPEIP